MYGGYQEEMDYRFYGWEHADVPAVNEKYKGIHTPKDLYDVLSGIWCADTCAPRMRENWTPENKTLGQCSITAFLAQDIFGGKVYGVPRAGGNYHCFNVVGDCVFDLTSEQFGEELLDYEKQPEQFREVHFSREEKRLRYEYLKAELEKACGVVPALGGQFEFRNIRPEEWEQAARIEAVCFPPNEACTPDMMKRRTDKAPELFLVAVDKRTGKIAGFMNGLSTDEETLRDEFFMNAELYDPEGKNVMILGLDVLPEYRGRGLAREIMFRYQRRERDKGRKKLVLTCLESKVPMYEKMGFRDHGMSASVWGGEQWHEMSMNC